MVLTKRSFVFRIDLMWCLTSKISIIIIVEGRSIKSWNELMVMEMFGSMVYWLE